MAGVEASRRAACVLLDWRYRAAARRRGRGPKALGRLWCEGRTIGLHTHDRVAARANRHVVGGSWTTLARQEARARLQRPAMLLETTTLQAGHNRRFQSRSVEFEGTGVPARSWWRASARVGWSRDHSRSLKREKRSDSAAHAADAPIH